MPCLTYFTNLLAILYFALSTSVNLLAEVGSGFIGYFSINFFEKMQFLSCLIILSTYTPGTWTCSGGISPFSTIYSTSATTIFAAVAISALKFLAVFAKYKFPDLSAFLALIIAKSPKKLSYSRYFKPLNILVFLGCEYFYGLPVPF